MTVHHEAMVAVLIFLGSLFVATVTTERWYDQRRRTMVIRRVGVWALASGLAITFLVNLHPLGGSAAQLGAYNRVERLGDLFVGLPARSFSLPSGHCGFVVSPRKGEDLRLDVAYAVGPKAGEPDVLHAQSYYEQVVKPYGSHGAHLYVERGIAAYLDSLLIRYAAARSSGADSTQAIRPVLAQVRRTADAAGLVVIGLTVTSAKQEEKTERGTS